MCKTYLRKSDGAVNGVAESIRQFGFQQPIVIDANNVIVAGHTRYKAGLKLGLKTVPCVRADKLTKEQVKAYRILDNKLNELAGWDFVTLSEELSSFDFNFDNFEVQLPSYSLQSFFDSPSTQKTETQLSDKNQQSVSISNQNINETEQNDDYRAIIETIDDNESTEKTNSTPYRLVVTLDSLEEAETLFDSLVNDNYQVVKIYMKD